MKKAAKFQFYSDLESQPLDLEVNRRVAPHPQLRPHPTFMCHLAVRPPHKSDQRGDVSIRRRLAASRSRTEIDGQSEIALAGAA